MSPKAHATKREEKRIRAIPYLAIVTALAVLSVMLYLTDASASTEKPQVRGLTAQQWYHRYIREHRALARHGALLRKERAIRRLHFKRDAAYAITLASSVFRVPASQMWAVARCETGGSFSPYSRNASSSASGLFQFLDSTWAAQGIAGFSVYDPVANALGAARIVAREGWSQWSCRP